MILKEGLNVKIILFPDGEDPDSYAHKLEQEKNFKISERKSRRLHHI